MRKYCTVLGDDGAAMVRADRAGERGEAGCDPPW